uniref:MMS19 nucleotide excision repair protein n=1 Tax=Angiostrongylus cantonensis TaxID=6313 RepID=A0A0K0D1M6_ANGCA
PCREFFEVFVFIATRLASTSVIPLISTAEQVYSIAFELTSPTGETIAAIAETMQSFGLLLDRENRLLLLGKIVDTLTSRQIVDMFSLFLVQSQDPMLMKRCALLPICGQQSAYRFCVGIANHEPDIGKVLLLKRELCYEVSCAISKGLLLSGKEEGVKIYEEQLDRLWRRDSADHEILLNHLCDIFDFDSAANNPQRCLFKVTFLWKQRVFNQLGKSYIAAVNRADEAGKTILMQLLSPLLKCFENNSAMQQLFDEFLPVFRTALAGDKEGDPVVLFALSRFIAGSPADKFSSEDSYLMIKALTRALLAPDTPMVCSFFFALTKYGMAGKEMKKAPLDRA